MDRPATVEAALSRVARKKEKTRRVLLDVALALFHEKGIYWTKIEDITERADIGKGTFYQYFESKEELLADLLKEGLDQLLARTTTAMHSVSPGIGQIKKIVEARLDFFVDHPEYLLLLHQIRGLLQLQTESSKELRRIYSLHLDQLGTMLQPALEEGGGKGPSARDLAVALAAFTSGLLTYHLLFDENDRFKHQRAAISSQIERGLLALI